MEILGENFESHVDQIFDPPLPKRSLYLLSCATVKELSTQLRPRSQKFGLMLVVDGAGIDSQEIYNVASSLVARGLVCFCAWGPDCERIHDTFDTAVRGTNEQLAVDEVIMTTWHEDESLEKTLWFFARFIRDWLLPGGLYGLDRRGCRQC